MVRDAEDPGQGGAPVSSSGVAVLALLLFAAVAWGVAYPGNGPPQMSEPPAIEPGGLPEASLELGEREAVAEDRHLTPAPEARVLGARTLVPGDRGRDVTALQRGLLSLGFEVEVSGRMDAATVGALRRFQADEGLAVDGRAGPQTLAALSRRLVWHTVGPGESLWTLAAAFGTTPAHLKRLNGLEKDLLRAGERLLLPAAGLGAASEAGDYTVRVGENLSLLAARYGVSVADLARLNHLIDPDRVRAGQRIRIPLGADGSARSIFPLDPPVSGRISSGFGWRWDPFGQRRREFHQGVDLAVPRGTPVRAAADGRVTDAGPMGAFGLGVVLDHAGGVETLYGHNERIVVRPGERVVRGQIIAYSGSSGRSTGPHLDFRVRVNGRYVDPTRYWR